ncbi:hypothetical protein SAMN05421821_10696 [Mucilaginibacter lappiensis]|uniref:NACHT domain-containing protein n=1 Tax=Mucilaginibacter lappiensis TaxID=354630 RepID=A0ABR6PKJ5_9SPHI|nr:ATP-binding protein [Mucilaginibacter lappiensis]MBB6110289.1 hypothetical protein [Mucilaginibacter lappiensis]SIR29286.1 hypothetical protein SAMN05421821_10696 [Mucilaginibacter lappiensis]
MSLARAHEGYEYQDLLSAYFILNELLSESNSRFTIDTKEFDEDRIDDLTISTATAVKKIQVKYSREGGKHVLEKKDLATLTGYNLAIDTLFTSWQQHPEKAKCKLRLCLAWNEPIDEIINVLIKDNNNKSFKNYPTVVYQIDPDKIWPHGGQPLTSWKRLTKIAADFDRKEFVDFCGRFYIEVNLPKFSLNVHQPLDLEYIVLDQVTDLGIGVFPNETKSKEEFLLQLIQLIKQARSGLLTNLDTTEVFRRLDIRQDYGAVYQDFPVVQEELITSVPFFEEFIQELNEAQRVILLGEPGSGKSWFLKGLQQYVATNGINVIHHLCYTDLNDAMQKDRIQTNVFYGNLIAEILQRFPDLKVIKPQKFASTLLELNHLLERIDQPTILIVDGLDHIERVRNYYRYHDIAESQVEIILRLNDLVISSHVKILVASQPISVLKSVLNFKEVKLPGWTKKETLLLMGKKHLENLQLLENELVDLIQDKAKGNPLYTNYLIAECLRTENLTIENFNRLPGYSYNLSQYYEYLFTNIKLNENVPQILSGVSFALTKNEINEITGLGDLVDDSLYVIAPVLKQSVAQSGYKIYHESFKRFVFDKLKEKKIALEKVIIQPVADWFEKKGVIQYPKAYRYFFNFLADYGANQRIVPYANKDFIVDSLYYGQPWDLIKYNYYYLKDAILLSNDLIGTVLINEFSKVLSSTENIFESQMVLYAEQLGNTQGFDVVKDYLLFEEDATQPLRQGLTLCYMLSEKGVTAPWTIYGQYFIGQELIQHEDLSLYIRFLLSERNEDRLAAIASRAQVSEIRSDFLAIFVNELTRFQDRDFVIQLELNPVIAQLLEAADPTPVSFVDLNDLVTRLIAIDSLYNQHEILTTFFEQIELQAPCGIELEQIITPLLDINWFYNWITYALKIKLILLADHFDSQEVINAFAYLTKDTEPFKGKPRSSDLHSIQDLILESLKAGLSTIVTHDDWEAVIGIIVKASTETSVSIQKDQGGPIPVYLLVELLTSSANDTNRTLVIRALEDIIGERKFFDLHHYISGYLFRLSGLYFDSGNLEKAQNLFREAIKTFTGYTQRRDQTLEDLLESLVPFSTVNYDKALVYIPQIKSLIDAIDNHTDGKDTRHFFVEWFKKFSQVNWLSSANYLLNDLKNYRSYWRLEDCLWNLLVIADGKINLELELLLTTTFLITSDHVFVTYCLKLIALTIDVNKPLAYYGFICLSERMSRRTDNGYSKDIIDYYDRLALLFDTCEGAEQVHISSRKTYNSPTEWTKTLDKQYAERQNLADISHADLVNYVKTYTLRESEIQSFIYYFDTSKGITDENKEVIREIVRKNSFQETDRDELSEMFCANNEVYIYYWVCRFLYDRDGWYNQLVNTQAFKNACDLDAELAKTYLFELLKDIMGISFRIGMSGNLVNALVLAKENPETITAMYDQMFDAISFRLPYQEKENWDEYTADPYQMSEEEVLFAILLARFRSFSVERYQPAITALEYLSKDHWPKLISPLKWFFKNREFFLDCIVVSVLQLVYFAYLNESLDITPLADTLNEIYPTKYYHIDAMIEIILEKPFRPLPDPEPLPDYPPIDEEDHSIISGLNKSIWRLENMGLPLDPVLTKYAATYAESQTDKLEIYGNRMYKQMAKNLYPSDYLMGLVNRELYTELNTFYDSGEILYELAIENKLIELQTFSRNHRPTLLPKPTSYIYGHSNSAPNRQNGWVSIAHYERELFSVDTFALKETISFGGLVFTRKPKFPISHHVISYDVFDKISNAVVPKSDYPIISNIREYDPLENLKLLWLPDWLLQELGLTVEKDSIGLKAKDADGKVLLYYVNWKADYLGSELHADLNTEIPKLDGAALMMEVSCYTRLLAIYGKENNYAVYRK